MQFQFISFAKLDEIKIIKIICNFNLINILNKYCTQIQFLT